MTDADLRAYALRKVRNLSTSFDSDDLADAIAEAKADTGFPVPTTDVEQIKWLKQRTLRHLMYSLMLEASTKFQVKSGLKLGEQFTNLNTLLKRMDAEFEEVQADPMFGVANGASMFGHKIDAGFAYDPDTGVDISYDPDQLVIVSPSGAEESSSTSEDSGVTAYLLTANFAGNGGGTVVSLPLSVSAVGDYTLSSPVLAEDPKSGGFESVGNVWIVKGLEAFTVYNDGEATAAFNITVMYNLET